ncbi:MULTISPECIES: type II toxin-antitoxin system Phd/YefM family antitoxin [Microbacterium]|uniref:Antitoxin n=1 Tax=Microbacterium profundi TaxID=450380 RepID=A0ABV3LG76_9MICO|nr:MULTISPECIES: type II toxin-antitoxin system prevent-host-death family antitoxin [Microbacterium]
MTTITHREMRNSSAEVLRRVEAGETITVTNHGHPVARLSPMTRTVLEELEQLGQVRLETLLLASLSRPRLKSDVTTAELISDVRGYDRGY